MNAKNIDINTIIDEVTEKFAGQFDQRELLNRILLLSKALFNAEVCVIFLRREENPEIIECVAGSGYGGAALAEKRKCYDIAREKSGLDKKSFTAHIVDTGNFYNIKSREQMKKMAADGLPWAKKHNADIWGINKDGSPKDDMRNIMAAPLKIGKQITGSIKIENKIGANEFSEDEFSSFKIISKIISLALENARLYQQADEQKKNVREVFAKITNNIVGSFTQEMLFATVLASVKKTFHAEAASLYLFEKKRLICVAGEGFATNIIGKYYDLADSEDLKSLTAAVYRDRLTIKIDSKDELEKFRREGKWQGKFDKEQWGEKYGFRNLLAIPRIIKDECLGLIKLENKEPAYGSNFSKDDQFNVETIANLISLTIKNFKLQDENSKNIRLASAKAAHRIINQILRYDYIEVKLEELSELIIKCRDNNGCLCNDNITPILKETIETTGVTTRNLKKMVKQFGQFAKPIELHKVNTNLNTMIRDAAKFALINEGSFKLNEMLSDSVPDLMVDPRFSETIQELIKNAIQAIREDVKNQQKMPKIFLKTKVDNGQVVLTVEDNGPGLPKFDDKKSIFDPFVTMSTQGTGLGLATVKELVEAHGGMIIAKEKESCGSIFEINLPILERLNNNGDEKENTFC